MRVVHRLSSRHYVHRWALACEPHYATRPIYSQKSHNSLCETIMKLYCIIDHLTRNLYIKQYYILYIRYIT